MKVLQSQNETDENCEQIEGLMKVVLQKGLEFTATLLRCKCFTIKRTFYKFVEFIE